MSARQITKPFHGVKETDVRETPKDFFAKLDEEFGFTLDACATPENALCKTYFTPEMDGLKQTWSGIVWCNPPYSNILPWIKKAQDSVFDGDCDCVVMLLPSRTGTRWWHEYAVNHKIRWIRGRLKFGLDQKNSAPFDCCLVIIERTERLNDLLKLCQEDIRERCIDLWEKKLITCGRSN